MAEICPARDCVIVFVGRSNVLLSAYMEAKRIGNHVTLPASGIRALAGERVNDRFSKEVLDPILRPALRDAKRILVVDFINEGGSLAQVATLIKAYLSMNSIDLQVDALGYGVLMTEGYRAFLAAQEIGFFQISGGGLYTQGTPAFMALESVLEGYAPYDEWNPLKTVGPPVLKRDVRRPYLHLNGRKKDFSYYASYNDVVEYLKKENPVQSIPPPPRDCNALMNGFVN